MATIKQIEGGTVHRIQSGQVIVDLCSVVKELVENSIDAGSTIIDVRFKNQGLDLIEVQDNGSGISPANYASVALKHHTSKLSSYADVGSLETFGFRGEALASLCALSTLFVTTCLEADAPKGSKLSFEPSGKLRGTAVVAAQRGTTVSVEKLFHNLPVRRRELERNIKREWHKVITLLNQYACIQTNLKFSVSQQPTKGKRIVMFSTKGNPTTRDNIINIFGAKTMAALVQLDLALEMRPTTAAPGAAHLPIPDSASNGVRIIGHVSRPVHGEGRQTPDRQMFFVNGRPCGLPQFAKTFNEVYKAYNSSQSPFILADIQLDTHMYDVNVSPDKRSILLHDQNHLLDRLRASLLQLFDAHDYSVPLARPMEGRRASHDTATSRTDTSGHLGKRKAPSATVPGTDSDSNSRSEDEESSSGNDASQTAEDSWRQARVTSSRVIAKEGRNQNLISQWVERHPRPSPSPSSPPSAVSKERTTRHTATNRDSSARTEDGASSTGTPSPGPITPNQDMGGDVNEESEMVSDARHSATTVNERPAEHDSVDNGAWVAALSQSPKARAAPRHEVKASSPPSPSRLSARFSFERTVAEPPRVTIGDEVNPPVSGSSPKQSREFGRGRAAHEAIPSFGSRLSQLYAADGTADAVDSRPARKGLNDDDESNGTALSSKSSSPGVTERREEISPEEPEVALPTYQPSMPSPDPATSPRGPERPPQESSPEPRPTTSSPAPTEEDRSSEGSKTKVIDEGVHPHVLASEAGPAEPRALEFQTGARRRGATLHCLQQCHIDENYVQSAMSRWLRGASANLPSTSPADGVEDIDAPDAENKLSLIIAKADFAKMRVAGQFNMGFIIAVRPSDMSDEASHDGAEHNELFIIDQHASDEKFNFERLQASTVVQSQRLVHPKKLELTALEEEIVMHNMAAIEGNGFKVDMDTSGDSPVGSRCRLLALPLSREITFSLADLEELISLLGEESSESTHIPRPSKVRKMFAMRACRSSIMIGKAMTMNQMGTLVRHMGELDKPWNCPHGRPTMRHLCQLEAWDERGWKADAASGSAAAWRSYANDS